MSTGFLLSQALHKALRKPYHQGDERVMIQYLVERLPLGEYRVMLKRNFDTACWIPPVGSRGSHSIYYGDRMVDRVIDFFCKQKEVEVPDAKSLVESAKERIAKAASKGKAPATPAAPVKVTRTGLLDEKVYWLEANLSKDLWDELIERLVHAVASYGRHERQHARNTPQDLKQVNKDLKFLEIPFTYFNLFEDARIEHISRAELGEKFDWLTLEDIAPSDNPFNMFLRCIQLEGERDTVALESEEPFKADDTRTVGDVMDNVEDYYRRACECTFAEQLYPIIAEFLREFKDDLPPPPDPDSGKGKGKGKGGSGSPDDGEPGEGEGEGDDDEENGAEERAGDLSTAAEAAEDGDKFLEEFEDDVEVVGGTDTEGKAAEDKAKSDLKGDGDKPPPKGKGQGAKGILESISPSGKGGRARESDFLARVAGGIDAAYRKRVDVITAMLMRMFKVNNLPVYLESESRRMSSRHLARNEIRYVHKKTFGGKGKRKFTVFFDCSGSMGMDNGRPAREGKLLLLALNNLAKRGYLEGHLVLSGYVGGVPSWLQYDFPVKDEIILSILTNHGAEGLQDSLEDNLQRIKGMDDVFVYTDAHITDTPLNRAFFAKHRVWPVGLYVGKEDAATEMERHFPQNIIRNTVEDLVETMLTRNRRTR